MFLLYPIGDNIFSCPFFLLEVAHITWLNYPHLHLQSQEWQSSFAYGASLTLTIFCLPISLFFSSFTFKNSYDCIKPTQIIQDCGGVQSLSCVQLFGTPWTTACEASLSFTISESLLRFMSIESVILSNHLFLCHFLILLPSVFPSIRVFSSDLAHCNRWSVYWSFSNIQGWFPLGLTGLILRINRISSQSKGLSRVFSSTAIQKHHFFRAWPSLWSNSHICKWLLEKP